MAFFIRIGITVAILHCSIFVSVGKDPGRYKSTRLESLCTAAQISYITDTLSDGEYYGKYTWRKYPLSIFVEDDEISHVGVQLFSPEYRKIKPSPVYNFLERFLLEYHLDYSTNGLKPLITENISILNGQLKNLHTALSDTTLTFSWSLNNGRHYQAEWTRKGHPWFRIIFPASYRLLNGYVADEAVRRLKERIINNDTSLRKQLIPDISNFVKCDSVSGNYNILKGTSCVLPMINNNRYYFSCDSVSSLIFSPVYPVESLANLLVTGEIENQYDANVRMLVYGGVTEHFTAPLNALINYFFKEGCIPFFGLKSIDISSDRIYALYEMVNETTGYEHLMSISFDTSTILSRQGTIDIRLTPYLPTHDIKNLFAK